MDTAELSVIIDDLRVEGSDVADIEVKRASGGYPESLAPTLSAFGNTPGGGLVLLGFDEATGFSAVGVYDAADAQASIAAQARNAVQPPLIVHTGALTFEGKSVVWAKVEELDASVKPCRLHNGKAYLRSYDGDYAMASTEEQAFIANRSAPTFDRLPVTEASRHDLNDDLVRSYIDTARTLSVPLAGFTDDEVLIHTAVMTREGPPTLGGLLSLGTYPQQFFPQLVIQGTVPDTTGSTRALDVRKFDGPIPTMLDQALLWVRRNSRTRIRFGASGHGRDEPEYPSEAVRELLSNALVHRDLGPYALGQPITLRIEANRFVLSNPGGLYGISRSQLGGGISSTRNGTLARILERVRTQSDERVVELVSSGIRTVRDSVRAAGMVQPQFRDEAIRFTVLMPNHALLSQDELTWVGALPGAATLSDAQRHALVAMRNGTKWNNSTLRQAIPMDSAEARVLLKDLVARGLARAVGEKKWRVYELADLDGSSVVSADTSAHSTPPTTEHASPPPSSDRPRALTLTDRAILSTLQDGPQSSAELAATLEASAVQVRYSLRKLRAQELITFATAAGRGPGVKYKLLVASPE